MAELNLINTNLNKKLNLSYTTNKKSNLSCSTDKNQNNLVNNNLNDNDTLNYTNSIKVKSDNDYSGLKNLPTIDGEEIVGNYFLDDTLKKDKKIFSVDHTPGTLSIGAIRFNGSKDETVPLYTGMCDLTINELIVSTNIINSYTSFNNMVTDNDNTVTDNSMILVDSYNIITMENSNENFTMERGDL